MTPYKISKYHRLNEQNKEGDNLDQKDDCHFHDYSGAVVYTLQVMVNNKYVLGISNRSTVVYTLQIADSNKIFRKGIYTQRCVYPTNWVSNKVLQSSIIKSIQ